MTPYSLKTCQAEKTIPLLFLAILAGCALGPRWHWERPGASPEDYDVDEKFCKVQSYSGTDGMVTKASVRRMHACLEARGWRKATP